MASQVNHIIIFCALFVYYNLPINGKVFHFNEQEMQTVEVKDTNKLENLNLHDSNEQVFSAISKNRCECAAFSDKEDSKKDKPIIIHSPMIISCDEEGQTNCNKLCTALAQAAKDEGPDILCSIIGHHHDEFKVSIHSRICNEDNWTYTGFTSTNSICCHEYKFVSCEELKSLLQDNKENAE